MAAKKEFMYVFVGFITILGLYLLFRQIARGEGFYDGRHSGQHGSYHHGGTPAYHTRYGGGYYGGSPPGFGWPWYWAAPVVVASMCAPNQIEKRDVEGNVICIPSPTYVIL